MKRKRGSGWYNHPSEHAVCSLGLSPRNTRDRKNIRNAISAELDAISMYEKIAEETDDPRLERLFRHIAREEKHHLSEFGVGLRMKDPDQLEIDPEGIKEALEQIKGEELTEEDKEKIIDAIRQKLAEYDPDKPIPIK